MSKIAVTVVAVLLVLAGAGAGGATAGTLVTSKYIKDGTIRMIDLNPGVQSAITAQTPTATPTVGDVKIVSGSGTATCPTGYKVLGGGGVVPAPDSFYYYSLLGSSPVGTTGWTVKSQQFRSSTGQPVYGFVGTAYAVCGQ